MLDNRLDSVICVSQDSICEGFLRWNDKRFCRAVVCLQSTKWLSSVACSSLQPAATSMPASNCCQFLKGSISESVTNSTLLLQCGRKCVKEYIGVFYCVVLQIAVELSIISTNLIRRWIWLEFCHSGQQIHKLAGSLRKMYCSRAVEDCEAGENATQICILLDLQ